MTLINDTQDWIYLVLFWALLALRLWAAIDCAIRKSAAFPAVNKLTKPAWLALTVASAALAAIPQLGPLNILSLVGTTVSCVYLADVRPAVREISGGLR